MLCIVLLLIRNAWKHLASEKSSHITMVYVTIISAITRMNVRDKQSVAQFLAKTSSYSNKMFMLFL